jgi:hypothetical protein
MTIGQNSVVRQSRCRNCKVDENYSDQQAEGTRSVSGGQSATEKVSTTKRRSKRLDTQAKEEIHTSEKMGAARASEVDRLMALTRGLVPQSLAARPDKTAAGKHWRRNNSDRRHERENLKLGRVMALLGRQNRRRRNSGRQRIWVAPAREQPGKQRRTSAHERPKHHTSDPQYN